MINLHCRILSSIDSRRSQVSIFKNVDFYKEKPREGVKKYITVYERGTAALLRDNNQCARVLCVVDAREQTNLVPSSFLCVCSCVCLACYRFQLGNEWRFI